MTPTLALNPGRTLAVTVLVIALAGVGACSYYLPAPLAEESTEATMPLAAETPTKPRAVSEAPMAAATETGAAAIPSAVQAHGQIIALSTSPLSFTIRTETGEEPAYRVGDFTVFRAGFDRPYNFGLLKVGDQVKVRGLRVALAGSSGQLKPGQVAPPKAAAKAAPWAGFEGQLVARSVDVRPAGEAQQARAGQRASSKGASNGVIQ